MKKSPILFVTGNEKKLQEVQLVLGKENVIICFQLLC